MAVGKFYLKSVAVSIVVVVFIIVGMFSIMDDMEADEAQRATKECKPGTSKCAPHAYCYGNDTSYECICKPDWIGDGFVGAGHSGCQKRPVPKSYVIAFYVAVILAAVVILLVLVDIIWSCVTDLIRLRARTQYNSEVPLAQQAYLHQEAAHGPAEEV